MNAYDQLTELFHKLARIHHAMIFLQWDQLVMMPPGGNESRAQSIAELTAIHHEIISSDRVIELIEEAKNAETNGERRQSLEEMNRCYNQAACLPGDLVKRKSLAGSKCEHGWRTQRKESDWPSFLHNFSEVVTIAREEALARQDYNSRRSPTPYDALLDLYCTGDSAQLIEGIFARLKEEIPLLLQQTADRHPSSPALKGTFPTEQQFKLNTELMRYLGFNFEEGRIDVSLHPFSTGDRGDQRITTRFKDSEFIEALMATAHETGHASYESGLPQEYYGLPMGSARNMCIHESQSLLFEKHIFLSQPFFRFFCSNIHRLFPQTNRLTADNLWSVCTHVQPSYIRVEADEITYPLHVILRFEIERDLVNGVIEAKDIPELWDDKMYTYLGLRTGSNHRDGCMQDIHWTDGSFGYFPSYTMGAVNSAQLFSSIKKDHPKWQERLAEGDTSFARNWLSKNVWQRGCSTSSQDIICDATGEESSADHLLHHLEERYITQG